MIILLTRHYNNEFVWTQREVSFTAFGTILSLYETLKDKALRTQRGPRIGCRVSQKTYT